MPAAPQPCLTETRCTRYESLTMAHRSILSRVPLTLAAALALMGSAPAGPQASRPRVDAPTGGAAFAGGPAALDALQQRLGGPLEILRVVVHSDSVEVDARDPRQPTHVDRYHYAEGRFEEPEPVAVGRNQRELQARLFPLASADLARVPELVPRALAEVRAEDGRVDLVLIERDERSSDSGTSWSRPLFRVNVSGPRNGGFVEFGLDGKRGRVVRW
jgi:hypothetical protein